MHNQSGILIRILQNIDTNHQKCAVEDLVDEKGRDYDFEAFNLP